MELTPSEREALAYILRCARRLYPRWHRLIDSLAEKTGVAVRIVQIQEGTKSGLPALAQEDDRKQFSRWSDNFHVDPEGA